MNFLEYELMLELNSACFKGRKVVVNTLNPHSYCMAEKDQDFKEALTTSDILVPDGIGVVWAVRILSGRKIKRIAGYDVFLCLMKEISAKGGSCFFLGSSDGTLSSIQKRVKEDFPSVKVKTFSPPYKTVFSTNDNENMLSQVNNFAPDVLFVGMTAPKQEKWVHQNQNYLNTSVICSVGAVFDFYAGTIRRPSKFWIRLHLEWLQRFLKEPRRLAERNLVSAPKFIWIVFKEKAKMDFYKLRNLFN